MTTTADTIRNKIIPHQKQTFFERDEAIETCWVAVLSKEHVIMYGSPGLAKSELARDITASIEGATIFDRLLDRQLPKDELFGPYDLALFDKTGDLKRKTVGKLPEADFFFADEIGKAGPSVLNPMLTAFNERLFHNDNGKPIPIPLKTVFAASNEQLEPELAAMRDRFLFNVIVQPIQDPANAAKLLESVQNTVQATAAKPRPTVTLAELEDAIRDGVPSVRLPPAVIDAILAIRAELWDKEVRPSDRRWKKMARAVQANAYLHGATAADEEHLSVIKHCAWDTMEQVATVRSAVNARLGEFAAKTQELNDLLDDLEAQIPAHLGKADEVKFKMGGKINAQVGAAQTSLQSLIKEAQQKGRSTTQLDATLDRAAGIRQRVISELLGI